MERIQLIDWLTTHGVRIVAILALAILATRAVRVAVRRIESRIEGNAELTVEQSLQRRATLGNVLTSVARVAVWTFAIMMILSELGLNLAPVVAGAGIAGVALGFGAQHVVRDVLAGFFMVIENQFQVGNLVEVQTEMRAVTGRIEKLSLRSTWVRAFDGTLYVVPNGTAMFVGNRSRGWARAIVDIPVSTTADLETTRNEFDNVLEEISSQGLSGVLSGPRVLGIEQLQRGTVTFRVVAETRPSTKFDVERELRGAVAGKLEELRLTKTNGSSRSRRTAS